MAKQVYDKADKQILVQTHKKNLHDHFISWFKAT